MSKNIYSADQIETINKKFETDDTTPIIRYMDFSKYVDLLERKKLFFCNSNVFEDDFEGKHPAGFYHGWPEETAEKHKTLSTELDKHICKFISCWNIFTNESYALWKIYTNPTTGVAIKSTVGRLKRALNNNNIRIIKTEYINSYSDISDDKEPPFYFGNSNTNPDLTINTRLMEAYKFSPYSYENEIRAIFVDNNLGTGVDFSVDLSELINEIYVSPFASGWFHNLVKMIKENDRYDISDKPVLQSGIRIRLN